MLPNFLCIGAQKSGTTSIWRLLNAHPHVFHATPRETQFFSDELKFANGIQFYESQYFAAWRGQPAVGEKCPEYLCVPRVAERIRSSLGPRVKFIVTLRNPAHRAFSHYRHNLLAMRETRTFEEAIAADIKRLDGHQGASPAFGYVTRGLYAAQLKRYLEHFGSGQFLFIRFERDICSDQRALAHRLCGFLNIQRVCPAGIPFREGRPKLEQLSVRIDQSSAVVKNHFVEFHRRRPTSTIRRVFERLMSGADSGYRRVYQPSDSLLQWAENVERFREIGEFQMKHMESQLNHEVFRDDIHELQRLTSLDFSQWLTGLDGSYSQSRVA